MSPNITEVKQWLANSVIRWFIIWKIWGMTKLIFVKLLAWTKHEPAKNVVSLLIHFCISLKIG